MTSNKIIEDIIWSLVNDPDNETRTAGIHGSDLYKTCTRQAFYSHVAPREESIPKTDTLGLFLRGKAIDFELKRRLVNRGWKCDTPTDPFELFWEQVSFHPDAYHPAEQHLVEIKVTRFMPKTQADVDKYYHHYQTQTQNYAFVLDQNKMPVKFAFLLFIDASEGFEPKVFDVAIPEFPKIEKRLRANKQILETALKSGQPPERNPGLPWPCGYCSFVVRCWSTPDGQEKVLLPKQPAFIGNTYEEIFGIVHTRSHKTTTELLTLVEAKQKTVGDGYLTDLGALHLVAKDLGINPNAPEGQVPKEPLNEKAVKIVAELTTTSGGFTKDLFLERILGDGVSFADALLMFERLLRSGLVYEAKEGFYKRI